MGKRKRYLRRLKNMLKTMIYDASLAKIV